MLKIDTASHHVSVNHLQKLSEIAQQTEGHPFVAAHCSPDGYIWVWFLVNPKGNCFEVLNLYSPREFYGRLAVHHDTKQRIFEDDDNYVLVSDDPVRDMSSKCILSQSCKFGFGKYKWEKIEDILEKKPAYVVWCLRNYKWFAVGQTLIETWLSNHPDSDTITPEVVQNNKEKVEKILFNSFGPEDKYKYE